MILSRYSVGDLPQGYFYLPIDNGGLGLRNPMIEFLSVKNMVKREPELAFEKLTKNDQVTYNTLKLNWETQPSTVVIYPTTTVGFMSFDEYTTHRITRLAAWRAKYHGLLRVHTFINAQNTLAMDAAIQQIKHPPSNSHDTWVFSAYGKEILEKFGSMEAVSPTLIPIGLVQLFKTSRTKWEQ
ncbi:hypothetical protein BD779DRAFT_1556162 [Infundibulicybe gibba]|nr:hypothetical protein BD779DRAFT_1556162 [Infundibulicybe gibba]